MELFHNGIDTAASGAHAGAHGVDALHSGPDGHLGAGAGLPGDVADLHLALGDFRGLQLEQTAHQVGVRPGYLHQGAPVALAHIQHIDLEDLALGIGLAGDLLPGTEHGLGGIIALAHLQQHIAGGRHSAEHGSGHELLGLIGVTLIHHAPLGFPDALDDHLLGGLGGNAAELLVIHGDADLIARLGVCLVAAGSVNGDLQSQVLQLVLRHSGLHQMDAQAVLVQIDDHIVGGHIPVVLPVLPVGIGQSLLQPLDHVVNGNALDLFQLPQACKNLCTHIYLGLSLGGFCFSCHRFVPPIRIPPAAAPARPGTFQM